MKIFMNVTWDQSKTGGLAVKLEGVNKAEQEGPARPAGAFALCVKEKSLLRTILIYRTKRSHRIFLHRKVRSCQPAHQLLEGVELIACKMAADRE